LARLREALSSEERIALEDVIRTRLVAEGTPAFALGLAVRVAVDEALEAQAGLPAFAAWREAQATARAARADDVGSGAPAYGGVCHAS
jgi:hypothetical protein